MLSYSENILQAITGKASLKHVTIEQLREIVDAYPYFGAAQFFLSKKMLEDKLEGFENALQKTALHFDNTLLLHFTLNEQADNYNEFLSSTERNNLIEDEANTVTDVPKDYVDEPVAEKNEISASVEDVHETTEDEKILLSDSKEAECEIILENNYQQDDEILYNETDQLTDATSTEVAFESNEKLSNLLKEQAEAFEKPVEATVLPIENIPHHRIDYFESQGIKLDPEKEANDKLGTQLKRFTDWLKQMKRINPNLNNLEADVAGEIQAQNMAARSNDSKEIVTEAMAEVLIKQGMPDEAIDIYEKLSFSNPSKSAYFAAKIKELKA